MAVRRTRLEVGHENFWERHCIDMLPIISSSFHNGNPQEIWPKYLENSWMFHFKANTIRCGEGDEIRGAVRKVCKEIGYRKTAMTTRLRPADRTGDFQRRGNQGRRVGQLRRVASDAWCCSRTQTVRASPYSGGRTIMSYWLQMLLFLKGCYMETLISEFYAEQPQGSKLKLRSAAAWAVCFEDCMACLDETETGNEHSQPKFEFTSLIRMYGCWKERVPLSA